MLSEFPFVAFRICADGTVDDLSRAALNLTGKTALAGNLPLEALFDAPGCARIRASLASVNAANARPVATSEPAKLTIIGRSGHSGCNGRNDHHAHNGRNAHANDHPNKPPISTRTFDMQSIALPARHGKPMRLYLCEHVGHARLMSVLFDNIEVLRGFIEASSEPMWGIEFDEPVNLDCDEERIVHQVFTNECHWIFCNRALKQLYGIPDELDMCTMPVSAQFPRSPQNEAFVRQLSRNGFRGDHILTVDLKHDGSAVHVENNVCGHIETAQLYRMWGTLHDITELRREREQLVLRSDLIQRVMSALPIGVIVIDRATKISGINPHAETLLGESASTLMGATLSERLHFPDPQARRRWYNGETHEDHAELRVLTGQRRGQSIACTLKIAPIDDESSELFVIALCAVPSPCAPGPAPGAGP